MKLIASPAIAGAALLAAAGSTPALDDPSSACTSRGGSVRAEARTPATDEQRVETVTLLVRGMMKSRSGAT